MSPRKEAAIIVIIYNLMGTLALCVPGPDSELGLLLSDMIRWPTLLLTLPINFISFGYLYAQSSPMYPVYIIQGSMLIIMLVIVDFFMRRRSKKYHK